MSPSITRRFAAAMEQMFRDDLQHATEVVLTNRRDVRLSKQTGTRDAGRPGAKQGRGRRAAAGAMGISSAAAASITNRRELGPAEAKVMAAAGVFSLLVMGVVLYWPRLFAIPAGVLLGLAAASLLLRAAQLKR